ncbi:MAG: hypothetical protein HY319_26715 [Armatimonadetes bacterium]|nr:hypothetical protein [Armatimonadota bacterium]
MRPSSPAKEWAVRGLTLAELVVSIFLVATALLLVIGVFLTVLRGVEKSADLTAGATVAESMLNFEIYRVLSDTSPFLTRNQFLTQDSPPIGPIEASFSLNNTVFTYRIYHQTVEDSAGAVLGAGAAENRLKKVDIIVWWFTDNPGTQRQGHGFLRTGLTRMVHQNIYY